ncbi:hypothetical protein ACEPPN_012736 [Leptodophora sp. 'Broadleaf-Isolate-01']
MVPSLDLSPSKGKGKERASSPLPRTTSLPEMTPTVPLSFSPKPIASSSKSKAATTTTRELGSDSGSASQSQSDFDSESNSRKPEPPSMTATEFEREVYKRALAEWEESHGFIKRFAERQTNGKLLSVNDERYRELVEEFRTGQKVAGGTGLQNVGAGVVKKEEQSSLRWFEGLKRRMQGVVRG